jgi:hypothetical protein
MRKTLVFHEENKTLVFLFKEYVKGMPGLIIYLRA